MTLPRITSFATQKPRAESATQAPAVAGGITPQGIPCVLCDVGYSACVASGAPQIACQLAYQACKSQCG
jgi:hypothetical protein